MTARKYVLLLIILHLSPSISIFNGKQCDPSDYAFMVELIGHKGSEPTLKCSGTLIKLDKVLTAAHCVQKFKKSIFTEPKAILYNPKGRLIIGTKEIHIHEEFNNIDLQYDMAILILEQPFPATLATTISLPVNEAPKNLTPSCTTGTFLGWGNTEFLKSRDPQRLPDELLYSIELPVISNENCSSLRPLAKLDTYFCTFSGFDTPGGGCAGDSGGPFICDGVQHGVASVNFGCGVKGEPTYFTRIDRSLDFIERHVKSSTGFADKKMRRVICTLVWLIGRFYFLVSISLEFGVEQKLF